MKRKPGPKDPQACPAPMVPPRPNWISLQGLPQARLGATTTDLYVFCDVLAAWAVLKMDPVLVPEMGPGSEARLRPTTESFIMYPDLAHFWYPISGQNLGPKSERIFDCFRDGVSLAVAVSCLRPPATAVAEHFAFILTKLTKRMC